MDPRTALTLTKPTRPTSDCIKTRGKSKQLVRVMLLKGVIEQYHSQLLGATLIA